MVIFQTAIQWAPSLFGLVRQLPREAQSRLHQTLSDTLIGDTTDNTDHNLEEHTNAPTPQTEQSTEYLVRNWLEAVFAWFQVVVLWHDPLVSLCTITGILTTFLTLTYFAPSFYATIAIAFFIYNLVLVWFRHVWPEIRVPPENEEAKRLDVDRFTYLHPQLMTLDELKRFLCNVIHIIREHYFKDLTLLRKEEPARFCLIVCSFLFCTAYIGNLISGISLLFILITSLVATPGIYLYLLPKKLKLCLIQFFIANFINCEYCIQSFTSTQQSENDSEGDQSSRAQIQQQHWHNHQHSLTSKLGPFNFGFRKPVDPESNNHGPQIIDQLIGYIARGPSSRVQPQETIPESLEESNTCGDNSAASCDINDDEKSQPKISTETIDQKDESTQQQQQQREDDDEHKLSSGSLSIIDSSDEQLDDDVVML